MPPDGNALFELYRQALIGLPVADAWRGYGSAIFLEFGKLTEHRKPDGSPGQSTGEITLMIEWTWRIERSNAIACGSWGNEELWEVWLNRCTGQQVADVQTFGRLPEIMVSTSNDIHILSFATTEGQPEWSLLDRRPDRLPNLIVSDGVLTAED